MKIVMIMIVIIFISNSCMKRDDTCAGGPRMLFDITYVDNKGNNLFTNNNKSFSIDSVRIFDLQNSSSPVMLRYFDSLKNIIDIGPIGKLINNYSKSLIHLKNGINDTIICHYSGVANQVCSSLDSIWYNGVLATANNNKAITIVK